MTHDAHHLMSRLAAGDEQAMADLLDRHWTPLVRYAFGLLQSWDRAEDVAQEAFARLWANRNRWSESSANALLHRIARNAALDILKSARYSARREDPETLTAEGQPDWDVECAELDQAVVRAVEQLPPRRREVFKLARESGFSYAQISEVMGVTQRTVANQMSLALSDLRVLLHPYLPETGMGDASPGTATRSGQE